MSQNIKFNRSLYWLYYAEACNEFSGPDSASMRLRATQLLSTKYVATVASRWQHCVRFDQPEIRSSGNAFVSGTGGLKFKSPVPETNALPLDLLVDKVQVIQHK